VLADGLSMVYSFYDPSMADRSLGTMMILDHIERAGSACLISTSATGSMAPARWPTRPASCPRNGWAWRGGTGWSDGSRRFGSGALRATPRLAGQGRPREWRTGRTT
jgi:hypothetical protein